jgi:hypothetical protein
MWYKEQSKTLSRENQLKQIIFSVAVIAEKKGPELKVQ